MGVNIPDCDFTIVEVIRELEKSRNHLHDKQQNEEIDNDDVLLITNDIGEKAPLKHTANYIRWISIM